jgi:hypothetical protein
MKEERIHPGARCLYMEVDCSLLTLDSFAFVRGQPPTATALRVPNPGKQNTFCKFVIQCREDTPFFQVWNLA